MKMREAYIHKLKTVYICLDGVKIRHINPNQIESHDNQFQPFLDLVKSSPMRALDFCFATIMSTSTCGWELRITGYTHGTVQSQSFMHDGNLVGFFYSNLPIANNLKPNTETRDQPEALGQASGKGFESRSP